MASESDTALSVGIIIGILGGLLGLAILFICVGKFCQCIDWKKCKCKCNKPKKEEEKKDEEEEKEAAAKEEEEKEPEEVKPEEIVYRRQTEPEPKPVLLPAAVSVVAAAAVVDDVGAAPAEPSDPAQPRRNSLTAIKKQPRAIDYGYGVPFVPDSDYPPPPYHLNLYEYEVNAPPEGHLGKFQYRSLHEPQKFHYDEKKVHGYVKEAMDIV